MSMAAADRTSGQESLCPLESFDGIPTGPIVMLAQGMVWSGLS